MARVCEVNSLDDEINVHKAVIAKLKQDIDERQAVIRVLISKKNTLTPVGTLPDEVLCAIFSWLVSMDTKDSEDDPLIFAPGWIVVSHVSRRWRSVALGSPNLWTQFTTFYISGRWVNNMLTRSSSANLSIKISYESDVTWRLKHLRKLEQIFRYHGERIAHLWLDTMGCEAQSILDALPTWAPRLRSLHLIASNPNRWSHYPPGTAPILAPDCLLNAHSLQELHLSYVTIAWDSHLLRNLTHVKIRGILRKDRPTSNELYDMLSGLTDLVDLQLDDALPVNDNNATAYFPRLPLHRLTRLAITSDLSEVQAFLRSLTLSTSTSVSIAANTSTPSTNDFIRLMSDATDCYERPISDIKFRSLRVQRYDRGAERSALVQLSSVPTTDRDFRLLQTSFYWSLLYVDNTRKEVGAELLDDNLLLSSLWDSKSFDLTQVTHIHLEGSYSNITSSTLQRTVGSLPETSYINLSENDARNTAEQGGMTRTFLSSLSNTDVSLDAAKILSFLPKLSTICFCSVRFRSTSKPTETGYGIDVKELRNCLVKRATYAPAITHIIIQHCIGVEKSDVEFLRQNIENVVWDGRDWGEIYAAVDEMFMSEYGDDDEDDEDDENSWDESIYDGGSDMYSDD